MLNSIRIKGFRKYKDFALEGFGNINFILGDNNVGKTSILESVFAWACGQNAVPFINIPLARGRYSGIQHPYWVMEELLATVNDRKSLPLRMIFEGNDAGKRVCFEHLIYPSELLGDYDSSYKNRISGTRPQSNEITSRDIPVYTNVIQNPFQIPQTLIARWDIKYNGGKPLSSEIVLPFTMAPTIRPYQISKFIDVLSHTSVAENVQIYASLKREKLLDELTSEIRKIFPEILGFDMIPYPDGSQSPVSVIKEKQLLPLYACGDGVQRWFYILGAMVLYKNSIMCIDEIDTGMHPAAQVEFSRNLIKSSMRNNVQLFISTHNIEFLDHFLEALDSGSIDDNYNDSVDFIKIITIKDLKEGPKARVFNSEEATRVRSNFNLELR